MLSFLAAALFSSFFLAINYDYKQSITYQQQYQYMSTISVCVRMRPFLAHQKADRNEKARLILQDQVKQVKVELTEQKQKYFKFNNVFGPQVLQQGVYSGIEALTLTERVVQGYHSTIFAYGQTGSGKTFTIQGGDTPESEGIIPKTIKDLFRFIQQKSSSDRGFKVFLSFIQIYNESIFDLIDPNDGKPLKMRWNKHQQFTVQNIFEGQCRSSDQALKWWKKGQKNKILGSHKMNNTSSRSHCLLTIRVQSFLLEDPSEMIESKLQIVDLAGSERQKVTKSTGIVFREGIEINKSLFTLRQVISSLYQASTLGKTAMLPPYRDSKLTSLLKQSIGGNSYCLMIACLNPNLTHFEESLQTLTYASMASYISNVPIKNIDPKIQQNEQLRQQNSQLRQQLKKLEEHIQMLTKMLEGNQCLQCKKKTTKNNSNFCKTQTKINIKQQYSETSEPTGLLNYNKVKQINEKSINIINSKQLPSLTGTPTDKEYQKIMKERNNNNVAGRTLKSTKEIIESIAMIRDLISANSTLRQKIEGLKHHIEKQEAETFGLMKQNQVLRDRWEMISTTIKPESQIVGEQAPIAMFQRMVREQRGEGLRLNSMNSQSSKIQTEGQMTSKMSYNQFLKGRKGTREKSDRRQMRRKNRIYSESKKINQDSMYI